MPARGKMEDERQKPYITGLFSNNENAELSLCLNKQAEIYWALTKYYQWNFFVCIKQYKHLKLWQMHLIMGTKLKRFMKLN